MSQQKLQKRINPGHQGCYWHVRYMPKSVVMISITQAIDLVLSPKQRCTALEQKRARAFHFHFICDINVFAEKSKLFRLSIIKQTNKQTKKSAIMMK